MLDAFGVRKEARSTLAEALARHNLQTQSASELKGNAHVSTTKFLKGTASEVRKLLMNMPEVRAMVDAQRAELGY